MRTIALIAFAVAACGRYGFENPDGNAVIDDALDDGRLDDGQTLGPSCMTLPATCGPAKNQSCCDAPLVTGGTFFRGYDLAIDGLHTDMTRPATVSTFRLDRYEVTVGRFRQYVLAGQGTQQNPPAAGAGAHAAIANSGWQTAWNNSLPANTAGLLADLGCSSTWTPSAAANEDRPIDCVDWFQAMAFCAWDGGYLPTEAEWHYAASGGAEQRAYPWSNPPGDTTINCSIANYNPGTSCSPLLVVGTTSPAGDGRWGHAELGGNALEWVLDWYAGSYPDPCVDCANLTPSTGRIGRGGSQSFDDAQYLRASNRYHMGTPSIPAGGVGMRCARAP